MKSVRYLVAQQGGAVDARSPREPRVPQAPRGLLVGTHEQAKDEACVNADGWAVHQRGWVGCSSRCERPSSMTSSGRGTVRPARSDRTRSRATTTRSLQPSDARWESSRSYSVTDTTTTCGLPPRSTRMV